MQKGQLTQWTWHIWVVGTITFSAKRSNPMQYAVGVSAKRSIHSGLSKYRCWGPLPLVQKGHCTPYAVDAVGAHYAVDVSAKRSTYTVDLANIGAGDHYL